jgi:hypothetical protein
VRAEVPAVNTTYVIKIPGKLYQTVTGLGVLEESATEAAQTAWKNAVSRPKGRGHVYQVSGSRTELEGVLTVLAALVAEVDQGLIRAYEIGVELAELRRVSQQPMLRTEFTTRELSQRARRVLVDQPRFNGKLREEET